MRRGAGALGLLRKFRARVNGSPGRPGVTPVDQLIVTNQTVADTVDPDLSDVNFDTFWGWGPDIGSMLTNIRAESPFTLVGGAYLYQPTLQVYGYSTLDVVAAGNSDVHFEAIMFTPVGRTAVTTVATVITGFATAWAQSYDTRPTGFELFPDTSLLQNVAFWAPSGAVAPWKPSKRITATVRVGKPRRFVFRFKTRTIPYQEYSAGSFLTNGVIGDKGYLLVSKFRGERGQVCGVKSAVNQPILTEIGANYMYKIRSYYFYRWVAGNQKSSIYGSNLGTNETVDEDALSWVGVNSLKSQRFNSSTDVSAGYTLWGPLNPFSKHEAQINPTSDCAGDGWVPDVNVAP